MSSLPLYLLQTVKELTCLQEWNSCWQKHLSEEAAPWRDTTDQRYDLQPLYSFTGLHCIASAVRNWSSSWQHQQPTNGRISLYQAVPQRDAYAEAAVATVTVRIKHLFYVHFLLYVPLPLPPGSGNQATIVGNVFLWQWGRFLPLVALGWSVLLLCMKCSASSVVERFRKNFGSCDVCRGWSLPALFPSLHFELSMCALWLDNSTPCLFYWSSENKHAHGIMKVSDNPLLSETLLKGP